MIGEILQAVMDECKKFYEDKGGTFIQKTDYDSTKLTNYTMPLCIFDLVEAPESHQFLGGASSMEWLFGMNSYNYQPNPTNDDDGGYSSSLLNVTDEIRVHFSKRLWLTQGMTDIQNAFGFEFTLSGVMPGDALDGDGLIKGYKIVFDSVGVDNDTNYIQPSGSVLEHVEQTGYPPTV